MLRGFSYRCLILRKGIYAWAIPTCFSHFLMHLAQPRSAVGLIPGLFKGIIFRQVHYIEESQVSNSIELTVDSR